MPELGEISEVKVIKADGSEHTVKLETIGIKRSVTVAASEPPAASPAAAPTPAKPA